MRSYRPAELFDEQGALVEELAALAPQGDRRMGANPHANGGVLLRDLELPDFREFAVEAPRPGESSSEATRVLGSFLRDVIRCQSGQLPADGAGRDGVQPPGRRIRRRPTARGMP